MELTDNEIRNIEKMLMSGDEGLIIVAIEIAKANFSKELLYQLRNHVARRLYWEYEKLEKTPDFDEKRYKELVYVAMTYKLADETNQELEILKNQQNQYYKKCRIALDKHELVLELFNNVI
ncbi:hypothetical protein AD998_01825 [bacterium 336/3]|nr:hypothetical protein AD998_01825 [bacterium 336/3]